MHGMCCRWRLTNRSLLAAVVNTSPDTLMALYLFNPLCIMASIAGTTTAIENMLVIAAVYAACLGSIVWTSAAAACATYLGVHPVLLLVR